MEIPHNDKEILTAYCRRANRLARSTVFREKLANTKLTITATINGELKHDIIQPPEDAFKAMLLDFRPFYLKGEDVNFRRVSNLVWKHLQGNDKAREEVARLRTQFDSYSKNPPISLQIDDSPLTLEEIIDLWLNAVHFHQDAEKLKTVEKLLDGPLEIYIEHNFRSAIINMAMVTIALANLIDSQIIKVL